MVRELVGDAVQRHCPDFVEEGRSLLAQESAENDAYNRRVREWTPPTEDTYELRSQTLTAAEEAYRAEWFRLRATHDKREHAHLVKAAKAAARADCRNYRVLLGGGRIVRRGGGKVDQAEIRRRIAEGVAADDVHCQVLGYLLHYVPT
jgi:hypothetical protein